MTDIQLQTIKTILEERARQDTKFGLLPRNLDPMLWLTVLTEEVGEVARAVLEDSPSQYEKELTQVAAVALAALEDLKLSEREPAI